MSLTNRSVATVDGIAEMLGDAHSVLSARGADVGVTREARRRARLWRIAALVGVPAAYLWWRILDGRSFDVLTFPHIDWAVAAPILFFVVLLGSLAVMQIVAGRSPHITYQPDQIDTKLADVVGIDILKEEVVRSLNLFLAHKTYSESMGGSPRRGLLFEGAPGTGKTYLAKAMASEAGVPFLFVSATSFQSMFYGATAKKIRSYFRELRKTARREGGAIGFIEEIDAIATTRGGMSGMTAHAAVPLVSGCSGTLGLPASSLAFGGSIGSAMGGTVTNQAISEGVGGVVNELLVQMQSFDTPTGGERLRGMFADLVNPLLPPHRQVKKPTTAPANVLIIAATNRAESLDPALLRPGRFDRRLTFELPAKIGRRQLIDHFLARKAHTAELDNEDRRDALAAVTQGYSPVMIEHIMDEALVSAVRGSRRAMTWEDLETARLTEEVGLGQPVAYTEHETKLIATHEAGHATLAWLSAPQRRLDVLSIIKRRNALGMLAHGDREDVFTRSRSEMLALIQIAMGGQAAEEIFFGDISTGPAGDLAYATGVAAEMVGSAGMAGSLMSFAAVQNSAFSDTNIVGRVLADSDGRRMVEELLNEQKADAVRLLSKNRHLVEALRDALLDRQELIGREITEVLETAAARHGSPDVIDLRDILDAEQAALES